MKPGVESQTAVLVGVARAVAHGRTPVPRFSDPTALALLPEEARALVERLRSSSSAGSFRERGAHIQHERRAQMMALRTVAIDDAIRERPPDQLVILGAGLDGRAWRMAELRDCIVFEVDHPDSQRGKRERAAALTPAAREVRFVPVDFARDDLGGALAAAGHDSAQPTTWIWEGVVMYLTRAQIEATLRIVAARSAPGSRLTIAYLAPALLALVIAPLVRRIGEPLRSFYRPAAIRALLASHGFAVVRDQSVPELAAAVSPQLARETRFIKHMRIVSAVRGT